jgi:hypothetical protein
VLARLRRSLSFSNVVALIALFVAIGGTSYAAITLKANSVGTKQLRHNAVTSSKVKDRSLLARDFKSGQLPKGAKGDPGTPGSPDTAQQVLAKLLTVDGAGSGLDADKLDGRDSTGYVGASRLTYFAGRADVPGQPTLGNDPNTGVRISGAGTSTAQVLVTNTRTTGNIIGVFQLEKNGVPVPFSANPGQTVTVGDAGTASTIAGHFTITVSDETAATSYLDECEMSNLAGVPWTRCFGTKSRD